MKRCGKSAPRRQQWRWQGKPHTEQDQIGEDSAVLPIHTDKNGCPVLAFFWLGGPWPRESKERRRRAGSVRHNFRVGR